MNAIDILGYLLIGIISVICLYVYFDSDSFQLKCIVSSVDGNKYCVRERSQIKSAADLLAKTTAQCKKLVAFVAEKYPDDDRVQRLVKGYNPQKIMETLPTSTYTAYSENKGEKLAFCLNVKKNDNMTLIDEHTLMFVAIGHAINPLLQKNLPYDADKAFNAVSLTAILPQMLALNPKNSATNLKELLALAKGPKPLNYATGGVGSSQHLATELLAYLAKVKLNHIPYKGGNQGLLDVIAGNVDFTLTTALTVIPHAKSGRVRALAVSTAKRLDVAPDVPTMAEAGIPGYESVAWYGMVAPAGIPTRIMDKLAAETVKATNSAEMKSALVKQGAIPVGNTPKQFTAFITNERSKYAKVIKEAGIKAE